MLNNIRSYGPGKFDTILDSYVYAVSLDGGCDAECGGVQSGGWHGMMRHGHSIFRDHAPFCEPLNDAERNALQSCAGVIITEDSQGFVGVEYFDTMESLDDAWREIEQAVFEDEDYD